MSTTPEWQIDQRVMIVGKKGYFWVRGFGKDGSVTVWGGSRNPNAQRRVHSVRPENLKPDGRPLFPVETGE